MNSGPAEQARTGRRPMRLALVYSVAQTAVGFVASWMLAVWLGVSDRGVLAAITMPLLLVTQVGQLAAPHATQFFVASGRAPLRWTFARGVSSALVSGSLSAGLLALAFPALLRNHPEHLTLARVLCLTVPATMVVNVSRSVVQARRYYRLVNWETLGGPILRVGLLVSVHLVAELSVTSAALVVALGPVLVGAPLIAVAVGEAVRDAAPRVEWSGRAAEFRSFQWRAAPGIAANNANRFLDRVILAAGLVGPVELGLYVLASSITEPANSLFASVRAIQMVETARRSGIPEMTSLRRVATAGLMLALGVLAAVPLVPVVYGDEYAGARVPLAILALGLPAAVIRGSGIQVLLAAGRPHQQTLVQWVGLGFGLAALISLAPRWGATGAAVASLITYVISGELAARWSTGHSAVHQLPRLGEVRWLVGEAWAVVRGGRLRTRPDPSSPGRTSS